jgi:hypothetical protein
VTGIYAELAWADTFVTENRFSWRGANAKAVLETGNGIADCCRRHVQIEGRRAEASVPCDGNHSLEFHQPTLVHCYDSLVTPSQFISIIATIKVHYGAAILNDARRLECPKHLSLTSSSAP